MGDVGGREFEQLKLPLLTTAACHLAMGRAGRLPHTITLHAYLREANRKSKLESKSKSKLEQAKVLLEKVTVCEQWGGWQDTAA